jgi:putative transposase
MATIPDKDQRCREIERLVTSGRGVCESCREVGVSEKTFYRWRKESPDNS